MEDLISRAVAISLIKYCANRALVRQKPRRSSGLKEAAQLLERVPIVDAVPVVRCADCIHSSRSPWGHPTLRWCPLRDSHRSPDWFCADGKKEEKR